MAEITVSEIQSKLARYFSRCKLPVVAAYLFGSYAREDQRKDSDVDVALLIGEPDRTQRVSIAFDLIVELPRVLNVESVDVCLLQDERNQMAFNALKNSVLIFCADDGKRAALETDILLRHFDLQDFERIHKNYLDKRIRHRRMGEGGIDMLDRSAVEARFAHIDQMLTKLKSYRGMPINEFRNNDTIYHAALYELQTCLEAMTDIAAHLVGASSLGVPENRAESFEILGKHHIISEILAQRLGNAVRMRNIIVHGYLRVALEPVYRVIQSELRDVEDFCGAVKRYIDELSETSQSGANDGK